VALGISGLVQKITTWENMAGWMNYRLKVGDAQFGIACVNFRQRRKSQS
jgi:hypothetical protein